jgi:hypothetical protein
MLSIDWEEFKTSDYFEDIPVVIKVRKPIILKREQAH